MIYDCGRHKSLPSSWRLALSGEDDGDCRESGQYREQAADLTAREYGSSAEEREEMIRYATGADWEILKRYEHCIRDDEPGNLQNKDAGISGATWKGSVT